MSNQQPKLILVFCDGTGMDGNLADLTIATTVDDGSRQRPTNVLRLSRAVYPVDRNNRRQIVFYQSGVGSEADFSGDSVVPVDILQALGTTVASKIRDAYAFIAQNYEEGDEICIFGFSRGAYTARKIAGLIYKIGLLDRKQLGSLFIIWRELVAGSPPQPRPGREISIKCVGVWDTVGAIYNEINALNIIDTDLPPNIEVALHALSMHENRNKFLPTLWTIPEPGLSDRQTLTQMWFAGAHSDVGGSYERSELADISLFWMAGMIQGFIHLDLDFLRANAQKDPEPWGTSQPHNSYEELPFDKQLIIGHETRLESSQIQKASVFHLSVQFSPLQLANPEDMITMQNIKATFGPTWSPTYPRLNNFEEMCRKQWGNSPLEGVEPSFEHPRELFSPPVQVSQPESGVDINP
ncbi:hypothetical protein BDV93DRAFT_500858 [Ceratobasidium sp. AG-I]|nr:hypothetical protein BDV93DRAFT_500858 [Ceratobasidium sp. AG-I]